MSEFIIGKILDKDFYANVIGRVGTLPNTLRIINDLIGELGVPAVDLSGLYTGYSDWLYAFTVDKKINSKKLIEGIASTSPYLPRFDNMGNFKLDLIKLIYDSSNHTIEEADVIDFSFSRTKIEDICTKIEFSYNWDYARGEFSKKRILDIIDFACSDFDGDWECFSYYGLPTDNSESTLVIDDDRGKYIRDDDTAEMFVCWMMSWYCNQHLIMKVKLPLKYMVIEIGEIVNFDAILGKVYPYGIDYMSPGGSTPITFQSFYPYFMVTETNKRLDYVEISCIQMHKLWAQVADEVDADGNMSYV